MLTDEEDIVVLDFVVAGDTPRVRRFSELDANDTGKMAPGVGPPATANADAATPAAFAPSRADVIGCIGIEREFVDEARESILEPGDAAADERAEQGRVSAVPPRALGNAQEAWTHISHCLPFRDMNPVTARHTSAMRKKVS